MSAHLKQCKSPGCPRRPSFGKKWATHCSEHKKDGHENVHRGPNKTITKKATCKKATREKATKKVTKKVEVRLGFLESTSRFSRKRGLLRVLPPKRQPQGFLEDLL